MKNIILGLCLVFPLQAFSADDSVYTWGAWSQGIKPAAGGPVARAAIPSPVQTPAFSPRANEARERNRAGAIPPAPPVPVIVPRPPETTPPVVTPGGRF